VAGFKVIELAAEAHHGRNQMGYDPCPDSLPGGSNTPSVQIDFHPDSGSVPTHLRFRPVMTLVSNQIKTQKMIQVRLMMMIRLKNGMQIWTKRRLK